MALFSIPQLKAAANLPVQLSLNGRQKRAAAVLEYVRKFSEDHEFDIFLSHKFSDLEVVVGLKKTFEKYGYSVYVDSEVDKQLDRATATKNNARILKNRMRHSRCLVVATTEHFQKSAWIPWEVGYFDGRKEGLVAVAPVTAKANGANEYKGSEYFALYPYIAEDGFSNKPGKTLWVFEHADRYATFKEWLERKPMRNRPKKVPKLLQRLIDSKKRRK
jgi:hypothetical protein